MDFQDPWYLKSFKFFHPTLSISLQIKIRVVRTALTLFLSALLYTSKMLADLPYIPNETAQVYHRLFEKWSRKIELPVVFHIVGTTWLFTRNLFDSRELMNIYLTRCRTAATESSLFFPRFSSSNVSFSFYVARLFPSLHSVSFQSFRKSRNCRFKVTTGTIRGFLADVR